MAVDPACSVLLLDKPEGPTSYRAARVAAQRLGVRKVGHTGTLDANVSGVLVIALGEATKAVPHLFGLDKGYAGTMAFETPQQETRLREAMAPFVGRIVQIPPLKSAVKRRPRERTVHRFEITDFRGTEADFAAEVEAGTYVRALLRDVGMALDTPIAMRSLRRTFVGPFGIDECVALDDVSPGSLIGLVDALSRAGVERVVITAEEEELVRMGRFIRVDDSPADDAPRVLADEAGRVIALARRRCEGLHAFRVFAER